ncbi:hypothetical protein [Alkaliphilus sp. B6464]|uniref:hypothetical protein n=1 Tax=Alkaliphilus sp. B6464 TaxID=2731219 RepID=UPI001BADCB1F|nr:hypothetical protein [Alkaliphilus sp. B6464]QUH21867.1 hypothetical protein HYG84_18190 [Alkaliphilus sp. B6464]
MNNVGASAIQDIKIERENGVYFNVVMSSAAGHYLGSVSYEDGYFSPNSRDTGYYPSADAVIVDFPDAITLDQAFECAKKDGYIK